MRHRELVLSAMLFLLTIFVITKMVPAHAEDSTDESGTYPTPTEFIYVLETPYPTMTEMAYDESGPITDPTQTDTSADGASTTLPEATATPTPYTDLPADIVTATPAFDALPESAHASDLLPNANDEQIGPAMNPRDATAVPEDTRQCLPATVELLTGTTTPSTMLEVRFDKRVISGGMSEPSGRYTIPLHIGIESPGRHPVSVVKRYSGRMIQQVFCDIP